MKKAIIHSKGHSPRLRRVEAGRAKGNKIPLPPHFYKGRNQMELPPLIKGARGGFNEVRGTKYFLKYVTSIIIGILISIAPVNASTIFYHPDHLGSSSVITDEEGTVVNKTRYYPFGKILSEEGSVEVEDKYTGQKWDSEIDLYYYNARYYDPEIAKFISPDPIPAEAYLGDPQQQNTYAYARNNPIRFIDPTGGLINDIVEVGHGEAEKIVVKSNVGFWTLAVDGNKFKELNIGSNYKIGNLGRLAAAQEISSAVGSFKKEVIVYRLGTNSDEFVIICESEQLLRQISNNLDHSMFKQKISQITQSSNLSDILPSKYSHIVNGTINDMVEFAIGEIESKGLKGAALYHELQKWAKFISKHADAFSKGAKALGPGVSSFYAYKSYKEGDYIGAAINLSGEYPLGPVGDIFSTLWDYRDSIVGGIYEAIKPIAEPNIDINVAPGLKEEK